MAVFEAYEEALSGKIGPFTAVGVVGPDDPATGRIAAGANLPTANLSPAIGPAAKPQSRFSDRASVFPAKPHGAITAGKRSAFTAAPACGRKAEETNRPSVELADL